MRPQFSLAMAGVGRLGPAPRSQSARAAPDAEFPSPGPSAPPTSPAGPPLQRLQRTLLACSARRPCCMFVCLSLTAALLLFAAAPRLLVHAVREGWLDQSVAGKTMVLYAMKDTPLLGLMKQGLFADFNAVIGALRYAQEHRAAAVRVFFDTDIYLDPSRGDNYWAYFFEPVITVDPSVKTPPEVHFNRRIARFGQYGTFAPLVTGRRPRDHPWPVPNPGCVRHCGMGVEELGRLTKQYIRVRPEVATKVESFAVRHFAGKHVIGVHFRGTDKKLLWPYRSPSRELFLNLVRAAAGAAPRDWVVFLATDESEIVDLFEREFPGKVKYLKDSPRLSASDEAATQGGTHKSQRFAAYQKGESAVLDCLLLAKAKYLIKNRSSLSDVALYFNADPAPRFSFVLADDLVWSFVGDRVVGEGAQAALRAAAAPPPPPPPS